METNEPVITHWHILSIGIIHFNLIFMFFLCSFFCLFAVQINLHGSTFTYRSPSGSCTPWRGPSSSGYSTIWPPWPLPMSVSIVVGWLVAGRHSHLPIASNLGVHQDRLFELRTGIVCPWKCSKVKSISRSLHAVGGWASCILWPICPTRFTVISFED